MKPYYQDDYATIYHGDCRDILPRLDAVDIVFSSPPYLNQRDYKLDSFDWYKVVPPAFASCKLVRDGQMFVNLGLKHKDGVVVPYWQEVIDACAAVDLRIFGWYVWDQGKGLPGQWNGRLAPSHEWIFHFNRVARQINKTTAKKAWSTPMGSNLRSREGINASRSNVCSDAAKVHDSVFRIHRNSAHKTGHPAVFPLKLASDLIQIFDGTVLDPFMGSGTTLRAAKNLGRKAIGIEIEEEYCETAANQLRQEVLGLSAKGKE